jgi:NTE family protein
MTELIADLRKVGLLAGIGDRHLERIAAVVSAQTVHPGETLVTEGSVGEDLYFVRRGSFVVSVVDGETSADIARLGPGDVIGETQLIAGGKRTATVRAFDECEVLRLPHAEFDALMAASETLRDAVARVIRHRLREAALRVALPHAVGQDPELLDLLSARAKWVRLERGQVLWEQGAAADSWYVLVSGELSIIVNEHGVERKVGSVRRGEVFGEVALIRGEPRSATIVAPRDSWLACYDANLLDEEILTRTGALRTLVLSLARRLSTQSKAAPDSARVITLLPRGPDTDTEGFVQRLAGSLGANGLVVDSAMLHREGIVGDAGGLPYEHPAWLRFEAWVESRRQDKNYLLLVTSGQNDPWTRMAVDQADTVLLLVNADSDPAQSDAERAILDRALASQALHLWLALEHPADRVIPTGTAAWLEARSVEHHAHVRRGHTRDIARLARWLMGRTLGIALSGGGARGFVHLGVVAAMVESGYEVDLIAGTSAGSMAGGLLACDEPPEKLMERGLVAIEANGNPFIEFDLPIISILRSRRLRDGLHQTYGEMRIEDSWIPLRILATDLTESRRVVFRTGLVWLRVLAASSPPGVMTPIKEGDHLYCDGGLVDNLPVSILLEENCSVKFASYVGSAPILPAPQKDFPNSWTLLLDKILRRRRHQDVPTLITTLLQCLSVPAAAQLEDAHKATDLLFHPDLSAYATTDFSASRAMFQAGQTHARAVLKTWAEEGYGDGLNGVARFIRKNP